MVRTTELVAQGTASQYMDDRPMVFCYKKLATGGSCIPCRYSTRKREYAEVSFPEPTITLRPEQDKVLKEMEALCMRQKEENPNIVCHPIFGHIHTGFGKSPTSCMFAIRQKGPVLIFCDRDCVRQGWISTWKEYFGINAHSATGSTLGKHDVCVCSIQLATRYTDSYRDDLKHYKVVICDEADTLCTQLAVNVLLDVSPMYFIGLTATVRRNDGLDKVLDILWGPRKHWIQRLKEFGEDASMTLTFIYTKIPVQNVYNRKQALDWMSMAQYVSSLHDRNLLIRNLCLLHSRDKVLILTKTLEHVDIIHTMLKETNIDVSTYCRTAKTYYDAHVLVATLSKAGRGYDDERLSAAFDGRRFNRLILCMTMRDAEQALGRVLRGKELQVYVLVDDNPSMINHAENMKNINSKRGASIVDVYM